jgi:hypothetical protein
MSQREFTPPKYEETVHVLFDKKTGEVLATEQRWTLVPGDLGAEPSGRSELLRGISASLGDRELDVLVLRGSEELKAQVKRIDVKLRQPIFEESLGPGSEGTSPLRIHAP